MWGSKIDLRTGVQELHFFLDKLDGIIRVKSTSLPWTHDMHDCFGDSVKPDPCSVDGAVLLRYPYCGAAIRRPASIAVRV